MIILNQSPEGLGLGQGPGGAWGPPWAQAPDKLMENHIPAPPSPRARAPEPEPPHPHGLCLRELDERVLCTAYQPDPRVHAFL